MSTLTLTAIRLQFRSGWQLGKRRDDIARTEQHLSSDTLKAALTACHAAILGPKRTEAQLLDFMASFHLSSTFPYDQENLYLPTPIGLWPLPQHQHDKTIRRYTFIRKQDFERLYLAAPHPIQEPKGITALQTELVQRVQVARPWTGDTDAQPYFVERHFAAADQGLYFLLSCPDPAHQAQVFAALHLLADQGIGLGKSSGSGAFLFTAQPFTLPRPPKPDAYMALGHFLPHPDYYPQLHQDLLYWGLQSCGGFMGGAAAPHQRRHSRREIYMLTQGSLFRQDPTSQGTYADLRPLSDQYPHPIYRDGRPILIPIQYPRP